jgi:tetratricopeptide (TPR) repeat protein
MASWQTGRIEEIDQISDGRVPWHPVRFHFGITSFGVNAFVGREQGDRLINEHDETDDGNEELYFVHSGRARFELDGETVEAPAGTFVFAAPEVTRTAFAEEAGTTLLALGGVPGKAYETHGWEYWAPFVADYNAGNYEPVAEGLREVLANDPPFPMLYYNAACVESMLGRKEDALAHLRRAVELRDDMRKWAENDSDLDAIRGEPEFVELFGEAAARGPAT